MPEKNKSEKTKFIVAMLASDPNFFVTYAQKNFAEIANGYLLSQHAKPHVTLVQFYGMEDDYLAVTEFLKTITKRPQPIFTKNEFGLDDDPDFQWAGLSVASEDSLVGLHNALVNLLKARGINVLNRPRGLYEPHLTFARIIAPKVEFRKPIIPVVRFDLAIGLADKLGQFVQVLNVFNADSKDYKKYMYSKL